MAMREKGSLAGVRFRTIEIAAYAKLRGKALRKSYGGDKIVWMDAQKTRAELAPGRQIRACEKVFRMHESYKTPAMVITSNLREMTVHGTFSSGVEHVLMYGRVRPVNFTPFSTERYSAPELKQVTDTATG